MEILTLRLRSIARQETAKKNTSPMLTTMAKEKILKSARLAVEIICGMSTLKSRIYRKKTAKPIIIGSIVFWVSFASGLVVYILFNIQWHEFCKMSVL